MSTQHFIFNIALNLFQRSLVPSSDLMGAGSSRRALSTMSYGFADDDLTDILGRYMEAASPEDYARQKAAFDAGHWVSTPLPLDTKLDRLPGGCMLNRATLYKLQTPTHRDRLDDWCIIVNSGKYVGGEAILPDLGLKLQYVILLFCIAEI